MSIILSAGIASQLVTKIGFKQVLAMGMAFIAAGFAILGLVGTLFLIRSSDSRAHVEQGGAGLPAEQPAPG